MDTNSSFFVIPLSIQHEGEQLLIGNTQHDEFYQFSIEAQPIIENLQQGECIDSLLEKQKKGEIPEVDIMDFVKFLLEIEFIYYPHEKYKFDSKTVEKNDKRLIFSVTEQTAKRFFSWPAKLIYFIIIIAGLYSWKQNPAQSINLTAFYFQDSLTLTLVALLLLSTFTVILHELAHMLAAANQGIDSKLGIGNRLWNIVVEADLSGILSIPNKKRYLPLSAGMLMDIMSICVIFIVIQYLIKSDAANIYIIQLLQALVLQMLITISWQFNLFLKTDIYYILCNYFHYPDLDKEARDYIKNLTFNLSNGRLGKYNKESHFYNKKVLNNFCIIWVAGRILSFVFLISIIIPTLSSYIFDIYNSIDGNSSTHYKIWDLVSFSFISFIIFFAGLYLWLKDKIKNKAII